MFSLYEEEKKNFKSNFFPISFKNGVTAQPVSTVW